MLDLNNKQKMLQNRMKELDAKEKRLSSIRKMDDFFQHEDLKQLIELEQALSKLITKNSVMGAPLSSPPPDPVEDDTEPVSQAARLGGSLANLESYLIKGDMRKCVLCNSEYTEGDESVQPNIPRVLYCGCCLCEACIAKQI